MRTLILAVACLWLVGCDPAYPPVIVNQYGDQIEIAVSFNGGDIWEREIKLEPNTVFVQRHKGFAIDEIIVKESSGKPRHYRATDFTTIRSNRKTEYEVWILSEEGLRLGDQEYLRDLRARERTKPR